jgi:hypothetical protein
MKTVSVCAVTRKVATVPIVVGVGRGRPNAAVIAFIAVTASP